MSIVPIIVPEIVPEEKAPVPEQSASVGQGFLKLFLLVVGVIAVAVVLARLME